MLKHGRNSLARMDRKRLLAVEPSGKIPPPDRAGSGRAGRGPATNPNTSADLVRGHRSLAKALARTLRRTLRRDRASAEAEADAVCPPSEVASAARIMLESSITLLDIKAEIDHLYQLPLADFVGARNQLATKLRRLDRSAAQKIKKLAKPSVSAWAVNQAYWQARPQFDALLAAGDKLRELQRLALAGDSKPGDLQAAMLAQRAALQAVKSHAASALERDGHGASKAMLRRVGTTLEALSAYGSDPTAPDSGRLSADVPAPGFDALSALADEADGLGGRADLRAGTSEAGDSERRSANDNEVLTDAQRAEVEAARAAEQAREQARLALVEARADLTARQRAIEAARALEKTALDRVYGAEKAIENAQRELARARATRDEALRSAEDAKADTRKARGAAERAELIVTDAEERLAELTE